jgi:hypothetical protein
VEAIGPDLDVLDLPAVDRNAGRRNIAAKIDQPITERGNVPALGPGSHVVTDPSGRDNFQRGCDLLDPDTGGQSTSM